MAQLLAVIETYGIPGFREPVSCFTHLFAAPVFLVLGILMLRQSSLRGWYRFSIVVLVFSSVFLLSMSGVYHMLSEGTGRYVMRKLDIAGVFVLIAGTATPIHFIMFRGVNRWLPLVVVWVAAVTGITLRSVFAESIPDIVGDSIFLLLGWGGAIASVLLWRRYGPWYVAPMLGGGIAYTVGVLILGFRWPVLIPGVIGPHELWHVAVLIGLGCHWWFIYRMSHGLPIVSRETEIIADELEANRLGTDSINANPVSADSINESLATPTRDE